MLQLLSNFCSLQKDHAELPHYMDDIKGCGTALEQKLRLVFFSIVGKFATYYSADQTRNTEALVQALRWNFLSRDFGQLHCLEVFKLLLNKDTEPSQDQNFG